ncbi:MAG TPA: hypothetical protein PK367_02255 [Candidatus Paceibacterota bacterium]|nr:hypothetical protein [Candidatus Paceibacterota bacterium]
MSKKPSAVISRIVVVELFINMPKEFVKRLKEAIDNKTFVTDAHLIEATRSVGGGFLVMLRQEDEDQFIYSFQQFCESQGLDILKP